jgi:hypothetical protein
VLSVAHLEDEERALVLGVVLEEILAWTREEHARGLGKVVRVRRDIVTAAASVLPINASGVGYACSLSRYR